MPVRGWNSVSVPGAVSAWTELHAKFGRLPFEKLFEAAIRYGREGFMVSPTIAGQWAAQANELKVQPGFAEAFMPGGRAPAVGEVFKFPEHAATLEKIAASKGAAFYSGDLAEKIEAHAGHSFNINSTKQLGAVLFEELKLPIASHTKTGWSTATEALEKIEHAHPIVPLVIRWRLLRRLRAPAPEPIRQAAE